MRLQNLALSLSLLLASATGAIAQTTALPIPAGQQRSPAGIDAFPYRPACTQLTAAPGGAPGWYAWGPVVDGEHQSWKGLKGDIAPETIYKMLSSIGLCVDGGAMVPLTLEQAQAASSEELTPMQRNLEELRSSAESGDEPASDEGFGAFVLLMLAMFGGVQVWERLEDKPWARKLTGKNPNTFDHVPPSLDGPTVPDRVSPDDLEDLPNAPKGHRSALDCIIHTPFVSRAIFGFQRTGKTNMAVMAIKQLHERYGVHAYVINLNAFTGNGEQTVYWQGEHITAVLGDLEEIESADEASALIAKAKNLVNQFTKHHGPAVLLVDEWSGMTASHATYADELQPLIRKIAGRVTSLASTGVQREKAVWTIAPEMVAETMDSFGKAIKKLSVCLVAIAPGHTAKWKTTELTFSSELLGQVRKNFPAVIDPPTDSEHSRIAYIDGQWRELGTHALVTVTAAGAEVGSGQNGPVDAAPGGLPRFTTTTDGVTGDLKLFLEWLESKAGELVDYAKFNNANKLKAISRSRTTYDSLCDKAVMKGWLLVEGDEAYRVNL